MKQRNPLFVAGFPYILFTIGYIGLQIVGGAFEGTNPNPTSASVIGLVASLLLMLIGGAYTLYWLIDTSKPLRKKTDIHIPTPFLLLVPFGIYWYSWRYGQAVEKYTSNKLSGIITFVLIILVGSIGMGIIQDTYNKMQAVNEPQNPPTV